MFGAMLQWIALMVVQKKKTKKKPLQAPNDKVSVETVVSTHLWKSVCYKYMTN